MVTALLSRRRLLHLLPLGGAGLFACHESAPANHLRNRVILEAPPLEAALWFVDRYPGYFLGGETGLGSWLQTIDAPEREFVLAMAQTLTWSWIEHERPRLDGASPAAMA
ncbi:MAG: hypothetical protein KC431_26740, partial [Myxococcales bacterium]|nr:hypothetical protein [Myxococcales bacterium]